MIFVSIRLSKLFGIDIYSTDGEYKGKVFDLIINLEKGVVETITTEALKPSSKQEAKRILSEKSIPYKKVKSAKDIIVVDMAKRVDTPQETQEPPQPSRYRQHSPRGKVTADQIRYKY